MHCRRANRPLGNRKKQNISWQISHTRRKLLKRIKQEGVNEIIIATNSTIEGQTTGQYIAKIFRQTGVKTSFLAHGMPIGSEMDYLDEGTLNIAFANRREA